MPPVPRPLLRTALRSPANHFRCQRLARPPATFEALTCQRTQSRHASTFRQSFGTLWKVYPFAVTTASLCIAFGAGSLLYSAYIYTNYVAPINTRFPDPVANKLRRAIYYSNVEISPQKAINYYKQALALADEHKMSPFSDEVIGIKLTLAAMLEKIGQHIKAIEVLEIVRGDCLKWIDAMGNDKSALANRTRVLAKTVGMSIKLGELYSNEYVGDLEAAEKNLVQGVEAALREQQRRDQEGVREGEGDWLSNEEIGGSLEALANHYEQQSKYSLCAPLFLRAVTLAPPSCHAAVLMNNLASSLAQTSSDQTTAAPTSRSALISNACAWAEKALAIARSVKPPERNEECDTACAVATYNLGEFAEMEGLVEEARKRYTEAQALAKAIGHEDLVEVSSERLKELEKS